MLSTKELQEISPSRLESDSKDHTSPRIQLKSEPDDESGSRADPSSNEIDKSMHPAGRNNKEKTVLSDTEIQSNPSKSPKPLIPDLTITPENDVFASNLTSITSSDTSSPKLAAKQPLVKGLYAFSISDTSDCRSPSLASSPRTKVLPTFYSPKLGRRFESLPDYKSATSSPTSPSRKFFRLMSSPTSFASGMRRGSEPLLDGKDLSEVQLSMTDRRWEKLRSILVAMKNEPFDADSALGLSTPDLSSLKDNIGKQEELSALRKELSALHLELELRDSKLNEALHDRNVALAYIKKLKLAGKDLEDENKNKLNQIDEDIAGSVFSSDDGLNRGLNATKCSVYTKEMDSLKKDEATKEDALSTLSQVVEELRVERSYLNHLMSVVLDRAPWMLDEVDRAGHWVDDDDDEAVAACSSDDDDDDYYYKGDEGEVWC